MALSRIVRKCAPLFAGLALMVAGLAMGAGAAHADNDWDSELWAEIETTCGENPVCVYGYLSNGKVMAQLVDDAVAWINEQTAEFRATSNYLSEIEQKEAQCARAAAGCVLDPVGCEEAKALGNELGCGSLIFLCGDTKDTNICTWKSIRCDGAPPRRLQEDHAALSMDQMAPMAEMQEHMVLPPADPSMPGPSEAEMAAHKEAMERLGRDATVMINRVSLMWLKLMPHMMERAMLAMMGGVGIGTMDYTGWKPPAPGERVAWPADLPFDDDWLQKDGFIEPGSKIVERGASENGGWLRTDSGLHVDWITDQEGNVVHIVKRQEIRDAEGNRVETRSMTTYPGADNTRNTDYEITDADGDIVLERRIVGPDSQPLSSGGDSAAIHPAQVPGADLSVDFIATSGTVASSESTTSADGTVTQKIVYDDGAMVSIVTDADGKLVSWRSESKKHNANGDVVQHRVEMVTQDRETGYRTDREILGPDGEAMWNETIVAKVEHSSASARPENATFPPPTVGPPLTAAEQEYWSLMKRQMELTGGPEGFRDYSLTKSQDFAELTMREHWAMQDRYGVPMTPPSGTVWSNLRTHEEYEARMEYRRTQQEFNALMQSLSPEERASLRTPTLEDLYPEYNAPSQAQKPQY